MRPTLCFEGRQYFAQNAGMLLTGTTININPVPNYAVKRIDYFFEIALIIGQPWCDGLSSQH